MARKKITKLLSPRRPSLTRLLRQRYGRPSKCLKHHDPSLEIKEPNNPKDPKEHKDDDILRSQRSAHATFAIRCRWAKHRANKAAKAADAVDDPVLKSLALEKVREAQRLLTDMESALKHPGNIRDRSKKAIQEEREARRILRKGNGNAKVRMAVKGKLKGEDGTGDRESMAGHSVGSW